MVVRSGVLFGSNLMSPDDMGGGRAVRLNIGAEWRHKCSYIGRLLVGTTT
jgi:hypothetical protein